MNKIIIKNRNLLERFSSSLIRNGKKSCGYKTLLESLSVLRQKYNQASPALQNNQSETRLPSTIIQNDFPKNKNPEKVLKSSAKTKEKQGKTDIFNNQTKNTRPALLSEKKALQHLLNKSICRICVDNVKPILETRKVRKGRVTYQVPLVTQKRRQEGKAITLLIENASSRKKGTVSPSRSGNSIKRYSKEKGEIASTAMKNQKHTFLNFLFDNANANETSAFAFSKQLNVYSIKDCLAEEFNDSFSGKGGSIDKKKQYHQLALQNRAYTHYRW